MKKIYVLLILVFVFSQTVFAEFKDVPIAHVYFKSINWLQNNGVVTGYGDGTFGPEQPVTRAEFLKMLYWAKGIGKPVVNKPTYAFSDYDDAAWWAAYVSDAADKGIIVGYADKTFRPGNQINVAEALKIVLKGFLDVDDFYGAMAGTYKCPFRDEDLVIEKSDWYDKYVLVADGVCAFEYRMISGANKKWVFDPAKVLSRGQMAELLYRVKAVKDNSLFTNDGSGMVQEYAAFDGVMEPKGIVFPNEFKFGDLKIGDEFLALKVVGIKPVIENKSLSFSEYNVRYDFDGEIVVSGTWSYVEPFADSWCFDVDDSSKMKLPKLSNDSRKSWFCFADDGFAEKELGPHENKGEGIIVIKDYSLVYAEAEVFNLAKLVKIITKD